MAVIKTKGVVINEHNSGDFDKVLTILTPDLGKITCFAKNVRRPKSTFLAGTSLFAFSDIMLYKGAGSYKLNACETIEIFYNLRIDLDKLNIATYITQIVNDITYENAQSYRILQLYLNTLYMISETDKDPNFILSVFKMKLLCSLGFKPRIEECIHCKTKENLEYFSIRDNGMKCAGCHSADKSCIKMSKSTEVAIKYIVTAPAKQLFSFNLKDESLKELELISKVYLNEKLEKEYKLEW